MESEVAEEVLRFMTVEFGNEGSRHEHGSRARKAVQRSRDTIAALAGVSADDVVFTSGATESNNMAILGLAEYGDATGKRHILSTQIEHKAVLEPLEALAKRGFEIELLRPNAGGWVEPDTVRAALRSDTLLVSVMHANNETGILQPIAEIAHCLKTHSAFFHTDAAQTFGKSAADLNNKRIDLISASAHKFFGPKGIGALIMRKRGFERIPIKPLTFGGGQERGLRPGTLAVPLIVGMAKAAEIAIRDHTVRQQNCEAIRRDASQFVKQIGGLIHGDMSRCQSHIISFSVPGLDSEALLLTLKDLISFSNGSACTSARYQHSHVSIAMGLSNEAASGMVRLSWCHMTPQISWTEAAERVKALM
jgi:cysteine desulfurase